ncbi:ankyrin repeat domain-containing protein [Shewanella chilikensis]|jgi:ankyrin repeat protein|nr:ankyrin repeat domain-containing protein [Shewanella chilikensis]MCA0951457.1 ankyrin repeat domain-containing protein [Shewanella chilikensis]
MRYTDRPEYKLYKALRKGQLDIAQSFIQQGCNIHRVTENDKWTYLHQLSDGDTPPESIQFLIEQGLDVNAVDSYGYTPLIYAVRQKNLPAIKLLLENGAEKLINHRPEDGATPLKMVFDSKPYSSEIVAVLLEAGADPDAKIESGSSFRNSVAVLADMPPEIPELLRSYPEKF